MTPASLIMLCYKCPTRCAPDFGKPMGYEEADKGCIGDIRKPATIRTGVGLRENGPEPEGNLPSLPAAPVRGCGLAAQ